MGRGQTMGRSAGQPGQRGASGASGPASPVSEERQERLCVEQVSLSFGGTQSVTDTRGPGLGGARAFWGAFLEELKRGR